MAMKIFSCGLLAAVLSACGANHQSNQDGHYENSDVSTASIYKGKQRVPAEYSRTQGIIVSESLISDFGREDIVKAAIDAGAKKVWVVVPKGSRLTTSSSDFASLRTSLGRDIDKIEILPQKNSGSLTVWARDWSPLGALAANGELRLLDLNYYPYRPADDSTSQAFEGLKGVERVSVPVYNEGGNFMANERGECLMTTRVTDANSTANMPGDLVLDANAINEYYRDYAGCRKVHIFPRMPTERTGHIDMWGKFLDDSTVIVNEISDGAIAGLQTSEQGFARRIQSFLEDRAADIAGLGYDVVRIPMPAPRSGWFRSYTNSLIVNGTAIVPQYSRRYFDANLISGYEAEVRKIYSSMGYKVVFIPSDDLISTGGAVHCVTMQVPE